MTCGVQNTLDEHVSSLECDTNDVRCSGHAETSSSRRHPAEIHHTIIGNLSRTESADNIHGTRDPGVLLRCTWPSILVFLQIFFHKINYSPMTFNTCISSEFRSSFAKSITAPLLHTNHHSTARSPCHPAVLHHTTSEGSSGSEAVHRFAHN